MGLYDTDKNVCFRIYVSFENQNTMMKHVRTDCSALFPLQKGEYFSLKLTYKSFSCSHLKTKRDFLYKDIQKIETFANGVVIYLKNSFYISISVVDSEKNNTEIYDAVTFLKRRCGRRFTMREPISYPEVGPDGRYTTDKEPLKQMSFSLTDPEIKQLLWYDYLFDEKMIVFVLAAIVFWLMSAVFWNVGLLVIAAAITVLSFVLSVDFFATLDGYIKNHQGRLFILMFDELLIVRLCDTDLELEYGSMHHKKSLMGLWRLQCGDFFTFVLPIRVVEENAGFFDALYKKII